MKTKALIGLLALLVLLKSIPPASAQGTAFTYQGCLTDSGVALNGSAEFQPTLWNAASGGAQVAANTPASVIVSGTNGLFVLPLNFGANFPGADRWLQLEVRTTIGPFTTLYPRQRLTPTPYAITASNLTGNLPAAQLSGALPSANLSGSYAGAVTFNNAANRFIGDGSGLTTLNANNLATGTVPDARLAANVARTNQVWWLGGNAGTTAGAHFVGTTDSQPLEFKVNTLRALRLENNGDGSDTGTTPDGAPNVIAGSPANFVAAGVVGATLAGGGAINYSGSGRANAVLSDYATVGGGLANRVENGSLAAMIAGGYQNDIGTNADFSAIGGGSGNDIGGNSTAATIAGGESNIMGTSASHSAIGGGNNNRIAANARCGTIAGGYMNNLRTNADYSAIGGGYSNNIAANCWSGTIAGGVNNAIGTNSDYCAIGGGYGNNIAANAQYATIPGGRSNAATNYAFAAGRGAKANHQGAFVWGDSNTADLASTNANSVTMRAAGGYRLFSNNGATVGAYLAPGGGSWASMSDRHAKENFEPVNAGQILEKVAALPLSIWNYKSQDPAIRHLGPMAQDFQAAFGVGESDTGITAIDADGVALAAIQGLNHKLESENAALKRELAELKELVNRLAVQVNGGAR